MKSVATGFPDVSQQWRTTIEETGPQTTNGPDLLRSTYVFLRKWPPVVAALMGWTQMHAGEVVKIRDVVSISFSIPHVIVFLALIAIWNAAFFGRGTDSRDTPRMRFLRCQSKAVVLGSIGCAAQLWLSRIIFPNIYLQNLSIWHFVAVTFIMAETVVILAAIIYEGAYQMSTPKLHVIAGSHHRAVNVYKTLRAHRARRNVVLGFVDPQPDHAKYLPYDYLGNIDQLERILMKNPVEMVCLALPIRSQYETVQEIVHICERIGVPYRFATSAFQSELDDTTKSAGFKAGLGIRAGGRDRALLKRAMDLFGATVAIVFFSPAMLLIAAAIKLSSRGPIFYKQLRCGKDRRCFSMYKFRTMVHTAESPLPNPQDRNQQVDPLIERRIVPRVTGVGRLLRALSLDELPQLFNVLKGEMSLVGPRPLSLSDLERISDVSMMRRFSATPGMTGLWQVSGADDRNFDKSVHLDLQYVDRWSLRLDVQILLRTLPAVLNTRGAA